MASSDLFFGAESAKEAEFSAERRVEQLLALNRAAIAITSELEVDALLQRIVDMARWLVGCHYAALGVLGNDGYIARFPTSGISEEQREEIGAPPRGHGLLGVMLRAGRTLRIPDISKDPRRSGFPPKHPPMTSLLGVPIFVRGRLVGDLYLTDKDDGPEFTEEDEWIVQLVATHAATALTNAQLHAANQDALKRARLERARASALLQVNQAINRSVHLDEVIGLIVQSTSDLLDASGAAFFLLKGPSESGVPKTGLAVPNKPDLEWALSDDNFELSAATFYARYAIGLEEPTAGQDMSEPDSAYSVSGSRLPLHGSLAGRSVMSGTTQVVNDTSKEPDLIFPKLARGPLRSLVATPLLAGDRVLGSLSAYSDRTDAFDDEAVDLLEAFGAAASTAIFNAALFEEAEVGRKIAEREGQHLRELEQMKDEFLSTAAHELRTPLTTLRISAGLVDERLRALAASPEASGAVDSRLLDLTGLMLDSSQRMQSLVNDLLDLTRLEQGSTTLAFESLDLREVLRDSVEATMPLFDSRQQHLSIRLPEAYCPVLGDRQRLEQVVMNLLSNANKYSPAGSTIEVRVTRTSDECLVLVRDNGPGVPESERELIFQNFYRSSVHRNDRTPSTGLGLPIARKIADMHGGRVWVEPAQGGGSLFTLALPALKR